jgi:hypothetical protein
LSERFFAQWWLHRKLTPWQRCTTRLPASLRCTFASIDVTRRPDAVASASCPEFSNKGCLGDEEWLS